MSDIKVNASFVLPGRTLPAEPPCSKKGKEKKEKKEESAEILYRQEKIRTKNQAIVINLRKGIPAKQVVHLSLDAYNYMTSQDNPPYGVKSFDWKRLSKTKRLKLHLQEIGKNFGGELEDFVVLED